MATIAMATTTNTVMATQTKSVLDINGKSTVKVTVCGIASLPVGLVA
jgi:hypothetical protein